MSIESSIRTKLATLTPSELVVVNESSLHRTAPGAETHFKVVIVSEIFKGLNRVERHQKYMDF